MNRSPLARPFTAYFLLLTAWCAAGCQPVAPPAPLAAVVSAEEPRSGELTPGQRRGREIYLHGTVQGGRPIRAVLGQAREPVDAALLACGNCHGHDGRGRPEGGVEPPDVTWQALSKPYGATDRFGRRRPAYTESLLGRVITMGLDSAGRRSDPAMPRYLLAPADLADLVSYLTVLGADLDPGLSSSTITIGALLPSQRLDPAWHQAVVATLNACAADVNRRGGLYNRHLEAVSVDVDPGDDPGKSVAAFLDRRPLFALLSADIRGVADEVARVVESRGIPLIVPSAHRPRSGSQSGRYVFALHSGLEDQALASATAARSAGPRPWAVIHADDPDSTRVALAVAGTWARGGRVDCERIAVPERAESTDPDRLVARLAARRTEMVAYLGPQTLIRPLLDAANRARRRPQLGLPGVLAGPDLFELASSFGGTIVLALPYLPDDMTQAGQEDYERLRAAAGLPRHHRAAQMAVLAVSKVLEEAIRRCGHGLSRASLIDELENLNEFSTGFSRPLTFGPNRRTGSTGAYLLTIDPAGKRLEPTGGWVEVEVPMTSRQSDLRRP